LASPSPGREKDQSPEEEAFEPEASEVELVETEPANHELANDEPAEEDTPSDKVPEAEKAEDTKGTDDMARFEPCFHVLMHEQGHYFQIQGLRRKARGHFRRTFLAGEPVQEPLVAVIHQLYRSSPVWDTLKGVMFATIINKAESVYKCEPRVILSSIFRELPDFAQDLADVTLDYLAQIPDRPSASYAGGGLECS
jgi:hypothetical protein